MVITGNMAIGLDESLMYSGMTMIMGIIVHVYVDPTLNTHKQYKKLYPFS